MKRQGCLILCYHHIAETSLRDDRRRFYVSPRRFEKQMEYLYKNGYSILGLEDLIKLLQWKGTIPKKSIVLTFDDGYRSFLTVAKDILMFYSFKATVFIPTGKVGRANDWDEEVEADADIMTWDEIQSLVSQGFSFHSHGVNHVRLPSVPDIKVMDELKIAKQTLESRLGVKEHFFCYPFSEFDEKIKNFAKNAGYSCACTTSPGGNNGETDMFLLRRVEVANGDSILRFIFKIYRKG